MATDEPTATLYYTHATVPDLMADLETLAWGLPVGAILRIKSDAAAVWQLIPDWCAAHGWRILRRSDTYEGEMEGGPAYLQGKYLFDLEKMTETPDETPTS